MAYSLRTKKEVINHVHQGMTILKVAQMYNISRQIIENWLKHPDKYLSETRTGLKPFDIEEFLVVMGYLFSAATTCDPSQWQGLKPAQSAPLTWLLAVASGSQAKQRVVLPKAVLTRLSSCFRIESLKLIR